MYNDPKSVRNNSENLRADKKYFLYGIAMALVIIVLLLAENFQIVTQPVANISMIPLVALSVGLIIFHHRNKVKAFYSSVIILIAVVMIAMNVEYHAVPSPFQSLERYVTDWCGFWSIVGIVAMIALIIYLKRCFLWSQELYDEMCKTQYETRKKDYKKWNALPGFIDGYIFSGKIFFGIIVFILTILFFLGFLYLPMFLDGQEIKLFMMPDISSWVHSVQSVMDELSLSEGKIQETAAFGNTISGGNTVNIVFKYLLAYIAVAGIGLASFILFVRLFSRILKSLVNGGGKDDQPDQNSFMKQYTTPICILLLGVAVIFSFVGISDENKLVSLLTGLLYVIVFILILIFAIEVVRLALDQCMRKQSILRRCIRYCYILIIDLLMQLIQGVIANFNVGDILSSIAGKKVNGNVSLREKVKKHIDDALDEEVDEFDDHMESESEFEPFDPISQRVREDEDEGK